MHILYTYIFNIIVLIFNNSTLKEKKHKKQNIPMDGMESKHPVT